jgi:predicted Zn-dependent protease
MKPILSLAGLVVAVELAAVPLISVQEEIEIGREAQAQVRAQVPEVNERTITAYVGDVGRQLAARAEGPRYPYSFSVADYREINAFALPGGPVWIHRGALDAARTEAQFAGVLAHEVAHISERHAAEQLTKGLIANGLLGLLGAVLGNDRSARMAQAGAQVLAGSYMLKFSRDDEREADRVGVRIMRRAGWDPRGMLEFMQVLRDEQRRNPSRVEVFLSSHPSPAERVELLSREVPAGASGRRDSDRFREVQRRLDRMPPARQMPRR